MKSEILIVAPRIPCYDTNAGDWRVYCISKILNKKFNIHFLPHRFMWNEERYIKEMQKMGIKFLFPGYNKIFSFEKLIKRYDFKMVIFEWFYSASPFLKFMPYFKKVIIDTHELQYKKQELRAKIDGFHYSRNLLKQNKNHELSIYKWADLLIAISEREKRTLEKELPNKKIEVIPTCVDVFRKRKEKKRKDIVFFASFSNPEQNPNKDGVVFFIHQIYPEIKRKLPEVNFHIGGYGSETLKYKNVINNGKIHNIYEYLSRFKIFVCPLRYGAGVKKKILDALASGTPVVTTPIGAEGLKLKNNREIFIADTPEDFAKKVVSLYNNENKWFSFAKRGYEVVKKNYSLEVMERKLLEVIW